MTADAIAPNPTTALVVQVPRTGKTPAFHLYYGVPHFARSHNDIYNPSQATRYARERRGWEVVKISPKPGPHLSLLDALPQLEVVLAQAMPQLRDAVGDAAASDPEFLARVLNAVLCQLYCDRDTSWSDIWDSANHWLAESRPKARTPSKVAA